MSGRASRIGGRPVSGGAAITPGGDASRATGSSPARTPLAGAAVIGMEASTTAPNRRDNGLWHIDIDREDL